MSKGSPFWVHVDFGSQTQVERADECPGSDWVGPFTWTAAKRYIVERGRDEIDDIRSVIDDWRHARLADFETGEPLGETE